MINVLKHSLNLYILPIKIDLTQILVDWKRSKQSMAKKLQILKKNITKKNNNNLPRLSF